MTIQEFAARLDKREYGPQCILPEHIEEAKELGYAIIYGCSDDLCELRGAIDDEIDCYEGGDVYISKTSDRASSYKRNEDDHLITAVWCDKERGCDWSYKTDLPHAEFELYSAGELFCIGIVIDMNAIPTVPYIKLNSFVELVHKNAVDHGWWDEPQRTFGELIALCHSELSEALEQYRKGHEPTETYHADKPTETLVTDNPKPEGIPSELADVIICILDMCGHYGIDIEAILKEKHQYNTTRPYKHGGKVI